MIQTISIILAILVTITIAWEVWLIASKKELISQTMSKLPKLSIFVFGLLMGLFIGIFAGHFWSLY